MTTALVHEIMVCIYISVYHLPHNCHTLVPEICVHHKNVLYIPVY